VDIGIFIIFLFEIALPRIENVIRIVQITRTGPLVASDYIAICSPVPNSSIPGS
jgi:hypothetical protein